MTRFAGSNCGSIRSISTVNRGSASIIASASNNASISVFPGVMLPTERSVDRCGWRFRDAKRWKLGDRGAEWWALCQLSGHMVSRQRKLLRI
jgi:hypothetical protein